MKKRQPCLIFARCVGWITPVQRFNPGKEAEYRDRKTFNIEKYAERFNEVCD